MCSVRFSLKTPIMKGILSYRKLKQAALIPEKYNRLWQRTGQHFQAVQGYGDKRRSVGKRFFQESRAGQA